MTASATPHTRLSPACSRFSISVPHTSRSPYAPSQEIRVASRLSLITRERSALSVHNHLIGESPRISYIHMGGHGDPVKLAQTIKQAVGLTKSPLPQGGGAKETAADRARLFACGLTTRAGHDAWRTTESALLPRTIAPQVCCAPLRRGDLHAVPESAGVIASRIRRTWAHADTIQSGVRL